jgi:hypothetical protein
MDSSPTQPTTPSALAQVTTMAAVVATLVYLPLGGALVLLLWLFGVSLESVVGFGGAVHPAIGLLIWWSISFVCSCAYSAWTYSCAIADRQRGAD